MATLLFSALGTLVAGPFGGALGALAGRSIDSAIIGSKTREGPRLQELAITTSSYGSPVPRQFGTLRVPGTIIWATDLREHSTRAGGGKGRPSTTTYSYTASFAVALSSRPLLEIGRIWADGNLLRGAAGDLKSAGNLRLHTGEGDQPADPLIAAAEGVALCPGFRGLAYAVFEDLDLSDFGNRIPALTFEVIADSGPLSVQTIVADLLTDCDAVVPLPGLAGLTSNGSIAETLALLDPVYRIDCDAGNRLTFVPERLQAAPIAAGKAAVSNQDGKFGGKRGFARTRANAAERPLAVLRYCDIARDYQPGVQRAPGRPAEGDPQTIELPAALDAQTARSLISQAAARGKAARESLSWRVAELDPGIVPGAAVSLPGQPGTWRVREWEWQSDGVELSLSRLPVGSTALTIAVDPGRAGLPADLAVTPTVLAAFELPWDGTGPGNQVSLHAAVSSAGAGWTGAALFSARGDGSLDPLGPSGRARAVMGSALNALPIASPLLFDRQSRLQVTLIDPAMQLANASPQALAAGANRALTGRELIQFARATPLGEGIWLLDGLLRGRGGTESSIAAHTPGEPFVMLDGSLVPLDSGIVGQSSDSQIAALGLADPAPVLSPIIQRGLTLRPLAPVHPQLRQHADGSIDLRWTRRARGNWVWLDHVDAALGEAAETYQVTFGGPASVSAQWQTAAPQLNLNAATGAALFAADPAGVFRIRQQGDHALSQPLVIALPV